MVHGDDKGVVLPPKVAKYQVVFVPIYKSDQPQEGINESIQSLYEKLSKKGVRCHIDSRDNYTAGWKFNDWESKGVPIRIEVGPNEAKNNKVTMSVRFNGEKLEVDSDRAVSFIPTKLKTIHTQMLKKAERDLTRRTKTVENLSQFKSNIKKGNAVMTPWCESPECEKNIQDDVHKYLKRSAQRLGQENSDSVGTAKILCIPDKQPDMPKD